MRAHLVKPLSLAGGVAILLWLTSPAQPQGSGSSRVDPPRATRPPTPEEFQESFWKYLNRKDAPYTKWATIPADGEMRPGETPHGKFTKTYANKVAAEDLKTLPHGAILVMENYAEDHKKLEDITIMYRVKGTDPGHYDWYWLKYLPNGTVARTPEKEGKKPIAGKVASCIECHSKAGGKELTFSNDPKENVEEK